MIAEWIRRHLAKRRLCRWCCGELIYRMTFKTHEDLRTTRTQHYYCPDCDRR